MVVNKRVGQLIRSPYDRSKFTGNKTEVLENLYKADNVCCYCGQPTIILPRSIRLPPLPQNHATVEHLYSRYDIRRSLSQDYKLACLSCNSEKEKKDTFCLMAPFIKRNYPLLKLTTLLAP